MGNTREEIEQQKQAVKQQIAFYASTRNVRSERYAGLYDRTQLYPSFAPSLDDPRMIALARGFNAG